MLARKYPFVVHKRPQSSVLAYKKTGTAIWIDVSVKRVCKIAEIFGSRRTMMKSF